jgi:hypothetical protein
MNFSWPTVFVRTLFSLAVCISTSFADDTPFSPTGDESPRDFTTFKLPELGVTPIVEAVDPVTRFKIGGQNSTELIRGLSEIAGRSIADLEADMRPGKMSDAGFLGAQEKLLDVLVADNRFVVDERRLTHQQLATHLLALAGIARWQLDHQEAERPFVYHGRPFTIKMASFRGFQDSPFQDKTKTNSDAMLENLDNHEKLRYSLLVPLMIERYGFYEGTGTPYRVDPKQVLKVLDFLPKGVKVDKP